MTLWDGLLVLAVTGMVTLMAMFRAPRRKALVLTIPVPFTLASIAVGEPVGISHVVAMPLLLGYTLSAWWLYARWRFPAVACAVVSAASYVGAGMLLNPRLPSSETAFWWTLAAVGFLGVLLRRFLPEMQERPRVDPLSLSKKLPIVVAVVVFLVVIKRWIGGFMTLFPMVGVLATYENREGLWSNVTKIPIVMITMTPLMATARLLEPVVGNVAALLLGWIPFLVALAPFLMVEWRAVHSETSQEMA